MKLVEAIALAKENLELFRHPDVLYGGWIAVKNHPGFTPAAYELEGWEVKMKETNGIWPLNEDWANWERSQPGADQTGKINSSEFMRWLKPQVEEKVRLLVEAERAKAIPWPDTTEVVHALRTTNVISEDGFMTGIRWLRSYVEKKMAER